MTRSLLLLLLAAGLLLLLSACAEESEPEDPDDILGILLTSSADTRQSGTSTPRQAQPQLQTAAPAPQAESEESAQLTARASAAEPPEPQAERPAHWPTVEEREAQRQAFQNAWGRYYDSVTEEQIDARHWPDTTYQPDDEAVMLAYARAVRAAYPFHYAVLALDETAPYQAQGGYAYYLPVVDERFGSLAELRQSLRESFTEGYVQQLLARGVFVEIDGQLYGKRLESDDASYIGVSSFEFTHTSKTRVTIDITSERLSITAWEKAGRPGDRQDAPAHLYQEDQLVYEYVDGRWLFTSFSLIY